MWEFPARADPQAAVDKFNANLNYSPESGESQTHTYYWLNSLLALGQLDPTVTADIPHYAVFNTETGVNYVFYKPGYTETTIHFSNGHVVAAQPRKVGIDRYPGNASGVDSQGVPSSSVSVNAYPNPFNPMTTISFDLPQRGAVSLGI